MAPAGKQTNVNANFNAARLGGWIAAALPMRLGWRMSWTASRVSSSFEQDLAQMIKTHFSDVLSQLEEQRDATDAELEEE